MQSPFKIFRKHQKVALAALTLMAMIGFGLGDVIRQMGNPSRGQREEHVVFETNIGNLTEVTIYHLSAERRTLRRFIDEAFARSHPEYEKIMGMIIPQIRRQYGFGGLSELDMLYKWLYQNEARKLGIVVSDRQIEDYIDQLTDRKLSKKKFQEILRDMQISPKELFDLFRDELEVQTAYRLTYPAPLPSPEKYWEYFQQLNTRQKIAVAAVPVNSFIDKTGEPTDVQVASLFVKYQHEGESAFNSEFKPGFRQPQKVKLQYLEIAYADAEKTVRAGGPITDKEVEEFYEANKATTIWMQEHPPAKGDDDSPIDPEITPEEGEGASDRDKKGPAKGPKIDQPPEGEKDAESENEPAKPQTKKDESKNDDAGKDDAKESVKPPECLPVADDDAANDDKGEQPEPKKTAVPTSEQPVRQGVKPQADEDGAKSQENPDKKDEEKGAGEKPAGEDSKSPEDDTGKPKIPGAPELKFKPLDDDIRSRIRESLITARTETLMKETADKARNAMTSVAESFADSKDIKLVDPDEKQLAELERRSAEELRKIAEKVGMKFGQTGLVSATELNEISGLGRAYDPESQMSLRGEMTTIVEQAFSTDALCQAFESETFSLARYVCWKVRDVAAHIPDLKEPGVREQVVAAWKRLEARPLAQKRAEELAQLARSSDKEFQAALADETVTGTSVGDSLVVVESAEFSYWQESTAANPFGPSRPGQVQLGSPGVVTRAGRNFMQVVFDQLSEGQVGVALNDDASIYYVVKVINRREPDREEFKTAKLFDRGSAYSSILQHELQFALQEHDERLKEKYAIRMKDIPKRRSRAAFDDE